MSEAMIRMYPKAAVLTNRHPFGGTDMMAQSLGSALTAVGYDPRIVNIDDASLRALHPLLGPWPFKRDVHALAIVQLREAGAQAIGLDLLLTDANEGDAAD